MKQHLATLTLATVAATTASLAVQQTTLGPIPQPTIVNVSSRVPAEDMVNLRLRGGPPDGTTGDQEWIPEYVVPTGRRLVIVSYDSSNLRIDGIWPAFEFELQSKPISDPYNPPQSVHVGLVVQPGSVLTPGPSLTAFVEVLGYLEDV